MIVCHNCDHENMTGAIFCSECGASLLAGEADVAQRGVAARGRGAGQAKHAPAQPPSPLADNWATLHVLEQGVMLPLAERNEFTMGRSSEGQSVMPDIDLSPYEAYARGVSRLHAVIKRGISDIVLMDLDSANGTFVNGRRLTPNQEEPLANGDIIALGKLKVQVLLRET